MLHTFEYRNFRSFAEPTLLSFVVDEEAPDTEQFIRSPAGKRLSKVMAIVGPNASGKTNVLEALSFTRWFMLDSWRQLTPEARIPVEICPALNSEPFEITLAFEVQRRIYRYELKLTETRVLFEQLSQLNAETNRYSSLLKRQLRNGSDQVDVEKETIPVESTSLAQLLRPNASMLSAVYQINSPALQPFFRFLASIHVKKLSYSGGWLFTSHSDINSAAQYFADNEMMFTRAKELLSDFDLGLTDIEWERIPPQASEQSEMYWPYGVHRIKDKSFRLLFQTESTGTQGLFILLSRLLPVLENGGVALIDDFESDLHPHMLPRLFELFFDPASNPHNAQLLFTTHAQDVFRLFDKRQIALVEKDRDGISHLYRLDDVEGIRADDNLLAKYNAGAYGAVPMI